MLSRSSEVLTSVIFFSLVAAQAQVEYPTVRGRGTSFPCGGYAEAGQRSSIGTGGVLLSLHLVHTPTSISVLIAYGPEVDDNFDTIILPTMSANGIGALCFPAIVTEDSSSQTDATIQVIISDADGIFYSCADLVFSNGKSARSSPVSCISATSLTVVQSTNNLLANGSVPFDGTPHTTTSLSPSATSTTSATGSSSTRSTLFLNKASGPDLSTGGKIGIGVSIPIAVALIAIALYLLYRRRRKGTEATEVGAPPSAEAEVHGGLYDESKSGPIRAEAELSEQEAKQHPQLAGQSRSELDGKGLSHSALPELSAEPSAYEMGVGGLQDDGRGSLRR